MDNETKEYKRYEAIVISKFHEDELGIEADGVHLLVHGKRHEAHNKFDIARTLRISANYLGNVSAS